MSKLQEARMFTLRDKVYGKETTEREAPTREVEGPKVSKTKVVKKYTKKKKK